MAVWSEEYIGDGLAIVEGVAMISQLAQIACMCLCCGADATKQIMDLHKLLKGLESYTAVAYRDRGQWSIGYGHRLERWTGENMSQQEAEEALFDDIAAARQAVARQYPELCDYSDMRQKALILIAFQLGATGLHEFEDMRANVKKAHWITAAHEVMDSAWARQTPERARIVAALMLPAKP